MRALNSAVATLALLAAAPALADEEAEANAGTATAEAPEESALRKRYDPGFGVWLSGEGRAYEGMNGGASAAGAGFGYSFDLVSIHAEYLQGLASVGERTPRFAKLGADYAFATIQGFSLLGRLGLTGMFNGPNLQAGQDGALLWGPELGFAARYRIFPKLDVFAYYTAAFLSAEQRRYFWNNGGGAGVVIHPFGSED
jgi:hypothetical protein